MASQLAAPGVRYAAARKATRRQRRRTPGRVAGTRAWAPSNIAGEGRSLGSGPSPACRSPPALEPPPATASPPLPRHRGRARLHGEDVRCDPAVRERVPAGPVVRPSDPSDDRPAAPGVRQALLHHGWASASGSPPGLCGLRRRTHDAAPVGTVGRAALASTPRPGPSGTARIGDPPVHVGQGAVLERGLDWGVTGRRRLAHEPGPTPTPGPPVAWNTAVADDPRIESAIVRLRRAARSSSGAARDGGTARRRCRARRTDRTARKESKRFCWNPMKAQSVHVGYIGY